MKKTLTLFAFIFLLISIVSTANAQTILYVNANAAGANNGNSWTDAYNKLSDALQFTISNPSIQYEIRVASGTYYPTGEQSGTNRNSSFLIRQGGGIKLLGGYDASTGIQNIEVNPTILSGDIGTFGSSTDNSYHVMVIAGLSESADSVVVDGFTISNGNANEYSTNLYYLQIVFNSQGGAIYLTNNANGGKTSIRNCTFSQNSAINAGGIFNEFSSPAILNCIFSGNTALNAGGGILSHTSSPLIRNCIFSGNQANAGGGLHNFSSSPIIINCVFSGNKSRNVYAGGGIVNTGSSSPSFVNCIIYGNSTSIENIINTGSPTVNYSNIEGGYAGNGNIDSDPLFVDAPHYNTAPFTGGDYRLQACSPSINRGNNAGYAGNIFTDTDLDGNPRLFGSFIDMGAYEYQEITPPLLLSCPFGAFTIYLGADCSATIPDYTLITNTYSFCGIQSITQFPAPGSSVFSQGFISVILTVVSNNGLTRECSILVYVEDVTLPTVLCPSNQTVILGPNCSGQLLDYRGLAQISDNCRILEVSQVPSPFTTVSGTGLIIGTMTAIDINGNLNSCAFTITKVDNSPPTITCPSTQSIILNDNCAATLPDYTGLAITGDNCGVQSVSQLPAPGTINYRCGKRYNYTNCKRCKFRVNLLQLYINQSR